MPVTSRLCCWRPACLGLLASLLMPAALARPADSPPVPELPPPGPSVFRQPVLVPWPAGGAPRAPAGFIVELFAAGLDHPRSLYVLPDGDVVVAESRTESMAGMPPAVVAELTRQGVFGPSANRIRRLSPGPAGVRVSTFLEGLRQPFGMALLGGYFYVANTDAVLRWRFSPGSPRPLGEPEHIATLPAGPPNNHWTRNLLVTADGKGLLVTVGSGTNADAEGTEPRDRAAIWAMAPDGSGQRLLATGLRNPVGLALDPATGELWTTVNERDGLGEDVPPDYLTRVVDGADYGWPWVYFGTYPDPGQQRRDPERVREAARQARVPDLALGAHSVPLGLHVYRGSAFPARYRQGVFVARRGGGSRVRYEGFDVVFVPFAAGRPTGVVEPFLTGFIADPERGTVHGRPVWLAELPDGSLLVSDDAGNRIWQVRHEGPGESGVPAPVEPSGPDLAALAALELHDQFGQTDSLAAYRGAPVVAVVVSVDRLAMIERWERQLAARLPGIRFLNVADIPAGRPVEPERVVATLQRRVPPEVPVLIDYERRWAETLGLATEVPNLLVFDGAGFLITTIRGRWSTALEDEVADQLIALGVGR